ncbi:MAG: hypothetical protein E5W09_04140 [Mesorhizobium sp.]|nr:MAG: hypothetical protein E5W09_04140 [Mesorhizobium sp.]TKD43365.1 MAG: hypothetical protein E5W98_19800 [Mesorhizobium sp.]
MKADRIVAERNFGGAMVKHVIKTIEPTAPCKEVTASRGKKGRISHQRKKHRLGVRFYDAAREPTPRW